MGAVLELSPLSGERGRLITFEGGEGAGKSTQLRLLADDIRRVGSEVVETREPGGTAGSEAVRHVVLGGGGEPLGVDAEAVLFNAARADLVREVIVPALRSGRHVLCDRYIDSSRAYQRDCTILPQLERAAIAGTEPDLTLIFDIDPERGLSRVRSRDGALDRFERSRIEELAARREVFLRIARGEPQRCVVIDADRNEDAVRAEVRDVVEDRLGLSLAVEEAV